MKKILNDSNVQLIVSILVLIGSFIINSLQGTFGFILPFAVFVFFILIIVLIYYIISKPLLEKILENKCENNSFSLEQIINYESTGDINEIWIISDLQMATDKDIFGTIIKKNIQRGIKYRYYIKNNSIIKERAKEILSIDKDVSKFISFHVFDSEPIFFDGNTDYDLYFENNTRNYILISKELFINLKIYLEQIPSINIQWNNSSKPAH